jgi:NAD(P)-dependent dehydrogenase (short-subunit alcohol dehydrogenase family)
MSNTVVLITGALTGIGRAAAVAFAKKGAKLIVAGRRDEAGKALVKELRSFGSEAEFINADVRKEDDVRALVDKTVARFGRLDVAVNSWHRRQGWPDHGPDRGKLCRDVRHECSRRDPEHEARSARHARTGQR